MAGADAFWLAAPGARCMRAAARDASAVFLAGGAAFFWCAAVPDTLAVMLN